MKRIVLLAGVLMFVCVLSFGTASAVLRSQQKNVDQTIVISESACGKLLSVQNDGSMPQDSLVQKYQIVCDNKGQKVTATMEVTLSKDGKVIGAKIIGGSKAMQGISLKVVQAVAAHQHCVTE
jgi:hypothetical protein